ncbi:nucleoid-associated protein [Metapseudomonas otitidis]|uniref:nucleoid-associated protein n=1 Tax=Metapseudomonas otitidis TaxID=319939 RepID=UPI002810E172|nr:nucleoid-associated protein [Pseudomonas otitidis]WMR35701.1 nucleoid-associated protein [Pseudomonas otitidis]
MAKAVEMKEDKNQSHNQIVNVIVHSLNRVEGGFALDERKEVLQVGETVQRLTDQLAKTYAEKAGKSHGRFEADAENYPVSKFLQAYFIDKSVDFVSTTLQMAETLRRSAQGTASTGGHVFFAHFIKVPDNAELLIVAILNDELGAALSKTKDVVDSMHLDIKGFRLAGRVNLTSWAAGNDNYLSFIKGKGQDKVSEFFKLFLGCNNSVAAVAETQKLRKALELFTDAQGFNEEQKEEFLRNSFNICSKYVKEDTPFELETFANAAWPDAPQVLIDAFEEYDLNISDGFVPDKRSLNGLVKFTGGTKFWRITFDRTALNNREIEFNAENETITIKKIPGDLLGRLKAEVRQDDEED